MTASHPRRVLAVFAVALLALTLALTGTAHATLTGSAFDTSNGTEAAATTLSWQNVAGSPALGTELGGTTCFGGGEKELTPNKWVLTTGTACTPGKSDLLGVFSYSETTSTDSFLHLAYDRASTSGDTFITFELNQNTGTWVNSVGSTIPCRSNNDILLSYELASGSVTINAYKWTGDGAGPVSCPNGAAGTFTQASSVTEEGSINSQPTAITNYLSTGTLGSSFASGAYGEGSLSVQSLISNLGLGCTSYVQVQAHTRSANSITAALISDMPPVPARIGNCAATGTIYNNTAGDGTHHAGEAGLGAVTVYADMTSAGHFVAGDPTTTTDSAGYYNLTGVSAGSHPLAVIAPAGYECTSPSAPCSHTVAFATSASAVGQDFELYAPPPPVAPTTTAPADGSSTNNNDPALSAVGDPGSTINFYIDNTYVASATADGFGMASLTPPGTLSDGSHTVHATETNAVGGVSNNSNTNTFRVDTVAPGAPVITAPAYGSSTDNNQPTLTATAESGSTVTFIENAPDSTVLGTAVTDGSGIATLTSPSLPNGGIMIHATATDAAGNTSTNSAPDQFVIDTIPPAVPTTSGPADGSTITTNEPTLTTTGAEPGSTVTFYVDGTDVGTAPADGSGNASFPLTSPLSDGSHDVYATDTDAAGNTSGGSNTNTFTVQAAPGAPTMSTPANGSLTNNNEPALTATSAQAGSTVTFYVDGTSVGTATADGSGNATLTLTSPLSDGAHGVDATATNGGGTSPDSNVNTFTVDTTAPSAPTVTTPAGGSFTNNNKPVLTATGAEPGSTITFYVDGTNIGTATADASGNATLTLTSSLPDGQHTVKSTDTDAAGNTSPDSNVNTFTVDTATPAAPTVTAPADGSATNNNEPALHATATAGDTVTFYLDGTNAGTAVADSTGHATLTPSSPLTDGTYTLKATQTSPANITSADSNVNTFTVDTVAPAAPVVTAPANNSFTSNTKPALNATGAEASSTVTFYVDGTSVGTASADGSGHATMTLTSPLADGPHTVKATDTDTASNTSPDSNTNTFTVKTSVAAPVVNTPANNSVSSNTSPTVTVTGEAGDTVTLNIDGTTYGHVTLNGSGHGSLGVGPLSAGQHTVKADQTDAVGNLSAWSATNVWTIKTATDVHLTAPNAGPIATNTPTVTYTGEAGDEFTMTVDGTTVATGVIPPSGTGSVTLTDALSDGDHTVAIVATDAANNSASDSVVVAVITRNGRTVHFTQAPALITQQTSAGFAFTDGASADTYECSLDGGAFAACPTPDTFTGLKDGPHSLLVRGVDTLGNRTPAAQYAWTVDTVAPPAPPILGGPNPVTTPGPTTFTISPEPGGTLTCSLDGSTWGPCPSVYELSTLGIGRHELQVRQTDEAGNVSPDTRYVWWVRLKAPQSPARHAHLLVAANATVDNGNTVDVGCNLNTGSVSSCAIAAYYHGKLIGAGTSRYWRSGRQHTVVHVHLNALGRQLLARAQGGLPVHFAAKAKPFAFNGVLNANTGSVLFMPLRFVLGDILFDFNSAALTPQAHALVAQLAAHLHGVSAVRCEGYTDNVGSPAYNQALGLHRAQAVCSLLRSLGVHARFRVTTYGQSRPVASNSTTTGQHTNRRVVVRVSYHDLP